eukprot:gene14794-biopygen12662
MGSVRWCWGRKSVSSRTPQPRLPSRRRIRSGPALVDVGWGGGMSPEVNAFCGRSHAGLLPRGEELRRPPPGGVLKSSRIPIPTSGWPFLFVVRPTSSAGERAERVEGVWWREVPRCSIRYPW